MYKIHAYRQSLKISDLFDFFEKYRSFMLIQILCKLFTCYLSSEYSFLYYVEITTIEVSSFSNSKNHIKSIDFDFDFVKKIFNYTCRNL